LEEVTCIGSADPWIPCRRRGELLHHGGDVCGIVVGGQRYFLHYSFCGKATEQEFFVPAQTLIGVILLIDGDFAFAALHNVVEGELGVEQTLKQSCCVKDISAILVAGVDFTVEMLYTFSKNKQ
jgi:hypothetical protein